MTQNSIKGFLFRIITAFSLPQFFVFNNKNRSLKPKDSLILHLQQARGVDLPTANRLSYMHWESDQYKTELEFDENLHGYNSLPFSRTIDHLNEREIFLSGLVREINRHQQPDKLKETLQAIFMADHDARQLEQFDLENTQGLVRTGRLNDHGEEA